MREVAGQLCGIPDMERLMTRIVYGSANGRELRGLYTALQKLPMLLATMSDVQSPYLRDLAQSIDRLEDVSDLIGRAIVDDPPVFPSGKEGSSGRGSTRRWIK